MYYQQNSSNINATLVVSPRKTSRYLLFNDDNLLPVSYTHLPWHHPSRLQPILWLFLYAPQIYPFISFHHKM